jgi:hypothetical protein
MDFAAVLPLAFVMIAGPQIISAFFFATAEKWRPTSAAYVFGASLSIVAVATAAFLLASKIGGDGDDGSSGIDWGVVALLVLAGIYVFRRRDNSEPPKWMGRLQEATPKFAFTLGFLLLGFFPSDLITSVTVGSHLGNNGDSWWQILPFVGLTLLLLSLPALTVAMLGDRAKTLLPKIRNWMNANSWIISEFVIVFFIVIVLTG